MEEIVLMVLFLILSLISNIKKKPKNLEELDIDFGEIDMNIKPRKTSGLKSVAIDTSIQNTTKTYDPQPFKKRLSNKHKSSETARQEQIAKASEILKDIQKKVDEESVVSKPLVSFDRDDLLKAFVMKELMQRYDLNRIYERIPSFNKDE